MADDILSLHGEVRKNVARLYFRTVAEISLSITQSDVDAGVPRHARLLDVVPSDNPPSYHVAQSTSETQMLTHEATSDAGQDGDDDVGTQMGFQGSTEYTLANIDIGNLSLNTLDNNEGHEATPEVVSPGSSSSSDPFDDPDIVVPDIYPPISHSQSSPATALGGGGGPQDGLTTAIVEHVEPGHQIHPHPFTWRLFHQQLHSEAGQAYIDRLNVC